MGDKKYNRRKIISIKIHVVKQGPDLRTLDKESWCFENRLKNLKNPSMLIRRTGSFILGAGYF